MPGSLKPFLFSFFVFDIFPFYAVVLLYNRARRFPFLPLRIDPSPFSVQGEFRFGPKGIVVLFEQLEAAHIGLLS